MRSKRVFLNISTSFILKIVLIIYGFVVPKIIIAKFGSEVNGLISSITQFLSYISLLESGFGAVIKSVLYKPISEKDNEQIEVILKTSESFFRKIAYVFIVYVIALIFIYPKIINSNFDNLFTISLLIIISVSTFAEYYFGINYRVFLQADQKTYIISITQILTYTINIFIIVILARINASIQIIKIVSGLIFILRPLLQNLYIKSHYNINLDHIDKKIDIEQKWDGLAQHIAYVIHLNTDITVLTIFSSLREVSVYSVYQLIVKGITSIVSSLSDGIDASWGDMIARGERDNLNRKFNMYEVFYHTINTIIFTCSIVLIVPFIEVYTNGIDDANYIRPLFGSLIVISQYVWAIRQPYNLITLAAGHFKQTRKGAWVECLVNIIVSIILVKKYGIIGVVIGTIIAMTIRTIEFISHTNKYILHRNIFESYKKILIVALETILIIFILKFIPSYKNISYLYWIINALITFTITSLVKSIILCKFPSTIFTI